MDEEIRTLQEQRKLNSGVSFSSQGEFDSAIYGNYDKNQYFQSLPDDLNDEEENDSSNRKSNLIESGSLSINEESESNIDNYRGQNGSGLVNTRISDRENEVSIQKFIE